VPINKVYVERLVSDIRKSIDIISSLAAKPYELMTDVEKYAVRYHLIVIGEALIAMAVHVARRAFGEEVESSTHALRILRDRGLALDEEYRDLVNFIRLRNLLVYRYWVIDDKKIYDSVKSDFKNIARFVERAVRYVG